MAIAELGYKIDSSQAVKATDNLDDMSRAAGGAEKSTGKMTKSAAAANVGMSKLAKSAAAAFAAFASFQTLKQATNSALNFGAAVSEVGTLLGNVPSEMAAVESASRNMAKEFGTTATSQAKAHYQAISAGAASAADAVKILAVANKLAVGGVTDVTTGVGILSGVVNAYGAENITASDASDALFVGMQQGVTTVGELSSSIGRVLPVAKAMGIDFDTTVAAVSALTKNSLNTSEAVTGLNAVLAGVAKPTKQASDMAKRLGLEFNSSALESKGLAKFLEDVTEKTGGNVDAMAELFGSVEAMKTALLFAGEAGGQFAGILEEMETKAGATNSAFEIMAGDKLFRLNAVGAEIRDMMLSLGNALVTVLVPAAEAVIASVGFLADSFIQLQGYFIAAAGVAVTYFMPALYAGVVAMGGLISANAVYIASLITLRGALIATGIGAVIVGIGLLINSFIKLAEATGGVASAVVEMGQVLSLTFQGGKTVIDAFGVQWGAFTSAMHSTWLRFILSVSNAWFDFLNIIAGALQHIPKMEAAFDAVSLAAMDTANKASVIEVKIFRAEKAAASFSANARSMLASAFDPAIAKASQLVAIVSSIGSGGGDDPLDAFGGSGPVIPTKVNIPSVPNMPSIGGGGGGAGGGVGGGAGASDHYAASLESLIASLQTEREAVDAWYADGQTLLNDRRINELLTATEHNEAKLRLEQEYLDRLSSIQGMQYQQQLSETAGLFGALQSIAASGGSKLAKTAATFGAIEGTINAYGAAIKALNTPGISLAGRFAAYASVLAAGLKGVAAIRSAGGGSGGSSSGGGASTTPTAAPTQEASQQQRAIIQIQGGRSRFTVEELNDIVTGLQQDSRDGVIIEGFAYG